MLTGKVMPKAFYKLLDLFKGPILSWLRKWVLEFLMKKILGRVIGGPWGWVFAFVFDRIWNPYIVPAYKSTIRFVKKYFRKKELVKKGKKTEEAKDAKGWKNAIDNFFRN